MLGMSGGNAYILVRPDLRGWGPSVRRQMDSQAGVAAAAASRTGTKVGDSMVSRARRRVGAGVAIGTGLAAAAAVGWTRQSVKLEAEFGRTMSVLQAATKTPAKGMSVLRKLAMQTGQDTKFSANEAAGAMLELAKGGLSAAAIKAGALKGTMTLAAAGSMELDAAAATTVTTLGQFNMNARDTGKVAAALAGAANASSAEVSDLSFALAQGGLSANAVGMSLAETTGVLAAFDKAGLKGSDAGTSLKTMLDRLQPATENQSAAFEELGLWSDKTGSKFVKANGDFVGAARMAELLKKGTDRLTESQKKAALSAAFGSDAQRAAMAMSKEGAKGLEKYIRASRDQSAAEQMAQANMRGTAGALEAMDGSIETAQLAWGQAVKPLTIFGATVVSEIANRATPLIEKFGKILWRNLPSEKAMRGGVGKAFDVIGSTLSGINWSEATSGLKSIGQSLKDAGGEAGKGFTDTLKVGSVFVGFFADHLDTLAKYMPQIVGIFLAWKTAQAAAAVADIARIPLLITQVAANTALTISNRQLAAQMAITNGVTQASTVTLVRQRVATIATGIAQRAVAAATKAWTATQWLLNAALSGNPIGLLVIGVAALVAGVVVAYRKSDAFRGVIDRLWGSIKAGASKVLPGLLSALGWVKDRLGALGGAAMRLLSGAIKPAFRGVVAAGKWLWDNVGKVYLGDLKGIFSGLGKAAKWLWSNAIRPAFAGIASVAKWLWDNVGKRWLGGIKTEFKILGKVVGWLWRNVVKPTFTVIGSFIKMAWNNGGKQFVREALLGLHRVGGVLKWLWKNAVKPALSGIGRAFVALWPPTKQVLSWLWTQTKRVGRVLGWLWENVARPALRGIGRGFTRMWGIVRPVLSIAKRLLVGDFGGAFDLVKSLARKGLNWVVNRIKGIPEMLRSLGGKFLRAGAGLMGKLVEGIKGAPGVIGGLAKGFANSVIDKMNTGIGWLNSAMEFKIFGKTVNPPDIPVIPKLAKGGRAFGRQVIVGDGREPESIIPDSMLNKLVGTLGSKLRGSASGSLSVGVQVPRGQAKKAIGEIAGVADATRRAWQMRAAPTLRTWQEALAKSDDRTLRWRKNTEGQTRLIGERFRRFRAQDLRGLREDWRQSIAKKLPEGARLMRERVTLHSVESGRRLRDLGGVAKNVVPPMFRAGADATGKAWAPVTGKTKAPVRAIVTTVLGGALVPAFNKIAEYASAKKIVAPGLPKGFASGGVLPGYTPGRDVHRFVSPSAGRLDLSGGEAIMRPEWTRAVGGPAAVEQMNAAARSGALRGPHRGKGPWAKLPWQKFFYGGVFPLPGGALTNQHASPYYGAWFAGDFNGPGDDTGMRIVSWKPGTVAQAAMNGNDGSYGNVTVINHPDGNYTRYAHQSAILVRGGQKVTAGQGIGRVGAVGNVTGPHLHFEIGGGAKQVNPGGGGSGGYAPPPLPGWAQKIVAKPEEWARGLLTAKPALAAGLGQAVQGTALRLVDPVAKWAVDKINAGAPGGTGPLGKAPKNMDRATPAQAQAYARDRLGKFGWAASQMGPLVSLWNRESGWRWNADNPTSSAYGIPQSLPGSKMASAGSDWLTNAGTQVNWGLGYIKGRYGSPAGAWAHSQSTGWYDRGGIARGVGYLPKATPEPERVLSPRQTIAFEQLTANLDRASRGQSAPASRVRFPSEFRIKGGRVDIDTGRLEDLVLEVLDSEAAWDDHLERAHG